MISVAVVGIGYWGKNLVRVFSDISVVKTCVHTGNETNEQWLHTNFPEVAVTTDYSTVLDDPDIDAIVIATPTETHYELARQAILAGKDVFVEKPLTEFIDQSYKLANLAESNGQILFVGFIFCYHPTIQPLIQRCKNHPVKWGRFSWEKLGKFNRDIVLDLAAHPISLALDLFQEDPISIEKNHSTTITEGTDIILSHLHFSNDRRFDIDINRISANSRKYLQLQFEDGEMYHWTEERLYQFVEDTFEYQLIDETKHEPLHVECQQFILAVVDRLEVKTNAEFGRRVQHIVNEIR